MARFLSLNLQESFPYLTMMQKRQRKILFNHSKMAIGEGWHMFASGDYLFHKGGTCCYRSVLLLNLHKKIGVACLSNAIGDRKANAVRFSMALYRESKRKQSKNKTPPISEKRF
jgi:hypothetical protein